ncbi:hypothetical protein FK088_18730 [Salmonella enterica]|nr:hypothetical protein [Salmonella enterica]EBI1926313.1 hypothetical protein [Salmonella enterica]
MPSGNHDRIYTKQFCTIRTSLDHKGEITHTRDLNPRSRGLWYCRSCNNPLQIHWMHDSGALRMLSD